MKHPGQRTDILIAGDSYTGLTLGIALDMAFAGEAAISIVGPDDTGHLTKDSPRAFALSAASKALLDVLDVWPALADTAQAVETIELTDSPLQAGIRPVLLTYDNHLSTGEAASYIVPAAALGRALLERVERASGIDRIGGVRVAGCLSAAGSICAELSDGRALNAGLLVCADGRNSNLRTNAGLATVGWEHRQTGIVATISHELAHGGKAVQHFLPAGPFALLPLKGNQSCITWSEADEQAEHILTLDDEAFLDEVDLRVGGKLGELALVGGRGSFALTTHVARNFVADRFALIGDAAHGVHPIAGQGLNLAIRDIAALTECLAEGCRVGLDIGDFTLLQRYERWRRFDSTLSVGTFDAINRLFAKDWPLLRSAREIGLGLVDRLPGIKGMLVSEAAGKTGDLPRLLKGENA